MADWRRDSKVDFIWRGALLASCLVHFCVVASGWMLISKPDKLRDLQAAVRISLVEPVRSQPRQEPRPPARTEPPSPVVAAERKAPPPPEKPVRAPTPEPVVQAAVPTAKETLKSRPKPRESGLPVVNIRRPATKQEALESSAPPTPQVVAAENETPAIAAPMRESVPLPLAQPDIVRKQDSPVVADEKAASAAVPQQMATELPDIRSSYLNHLRERIERFKKYPFMARKGHQQGIVFVEFKLSKGGDLQAFELKKSCGHRLLDRAAVQAVEAAAPFSAIPPQISATGTNFIVPVRFVLD